MTDQPTEPSVSAVHDAPRPPVADRAAFQAELDRLRVREKAHTREGDAIAAARRRLRWSKSIRELRSPERTGRSR